MANKCIESGCLGGCCENITIYDLEETILKTFPDAKEVSAWELRKLILSPVTTGVYYNYDGRSDVGMVIARISGVCPHKNQQGSCKIYGNCSRASEKFGFGSDDCNKIRKSLGLKKVSPKSFS